MAWIACGGGPVSSSGGNRPTLRTPSRPTGTGGYMNSSESRGRASAPPSSRSCGRAFWRAWPAIDRGAIVADDVQQSPAFERSSASTAAAQAYVAPADDGNALFGIALKDV
jgi:hypothetical protein